MDGRFLLMLKEDFSNQSLVLLPEVARVIDEDINRLALERRDHLVLNSIIVRDIDSSDNFHFESI
jgi:hypothetical protein